MLGQTPKKAAAKAAVGIVYVDGPITLGGGQPSPFDATQARSSHDPQGPRRGRPG